MSMILNNLLLSPEGYQISRSVRLRSSASAYFNRTPASAGNRKTWTWSAWVKRGALGVTQWLFDADNGSTDSTEFNFAIGSGNTISIGGSVTTWRVTTQVFRDPSAWYHIVLAIDTTQATANNRIRLYVNGSEITAFSTLNNPTQNLDLAVNQTIAHYLGIRTGLTSPLDGYLTEINFIDGQALTPASFGETNPVTGVWQPKKYTGTYGTNGFYLNFSDNSSNTATTIGKDYSGNGNNWTPNNISVTSGSTYDSMLDVPTQWADGGNGRGNYAVLNPLATFGATLSEANLKNTAPAGDFWYNAVCTIAVPQSGKWYFEATAGALSSGLNRFMVGLVDDSFNTKSLVSIGSTAFSYGYFGVDGNKYNNGSGSAYGATYTTNDVIGVALDMDAGTLTFYKNNVSQGTAYTGLTRQYFFAVGVYNSASIFANFGQRPFAYTPPSGFKALNTLNLPTPTILKGNQYFDVALQTGNTTGRTVSGLAFQPDLVIVKNRAGSTNRRWGVIDSVRGVNKTLSTALTDAEVTSQTDLLTTFNSDGFTIGADAGLYGWNGFAESYAHFTWKEGATQGFDIVLYTGTGVNRTVAHNLGVAPRMMIIKCRNNLSGATVWPVYHASVGNTAYLELNSTVAATTLSIGWNNTSPTSTDFTVGTAAGVNGNGNTFVAYLFAAVAGFSAFGSYTGNGSTDGPFVFCGFRPRFVMTKRTDTTGPWQILDTARDTYNSAVAALFPNTSGAEASFTQPNGIDYLSNGFKLRNSSTDDNANGGTYIFAAFCENPFKNALAR